MPVVITNGENTAQQNPRKQRRCVMYRLVALAHSGNSLNMKMLTRAQVASRKAKAVRFVENVLGDSSRADEIEAEPLEHYAQRRRIQIQNPRRTVMPTKTDLQNRVAELEEENQILNDKIDAVVDLFAGGDEGDDTVDGDDDGDDSDDDDQD